MGKKLSGRTNDFLSDQNPDKFFFVRTMSGLSGRTNNCPVNSKQDCSPFFGILPFKIKADMDRDNYQFVLATWRGS